MKKSWQYQLPCFPSYRRRGDTELYPTLRDAALSSNKHLTVNPFYAYPHGPVAKHFDSYHQDVEDYWKDEYSRLTLFHEIEATLPESSDVLSELMFNERQNEREDISKEDLATLSIEAFENHILRCWEPEKIHVMPHSSGYDSRIVSGIIKKILQEKRREWMGEPMRFFCWEPEIASTRRIMDIKSSEDWGPKEFQPIREGNWVDYFAEIADFAYLGANLSESIIPQYGQLLFKKACADHGIDPSEAQVVSAYHSDEIAVWNIRKMFSPAFFVVSYLYRDHNPWYRYTDEIIPFVCHDFIEIMQKYNIPQPLDDFKREMLKQINPSLLEVKNYRFHYAATMKVQGFVDTQRLSLKTQEKFTEDFRASWYAKALNREDFVFPEILYYAPSSDEIKEYTRAALCEYLIKEGVEIRI